MNSRQENRSKLSSTARIMTKYSLERFLSICGEKMSEGFLKFYKLIIKPDTRSDHCLKSWIIERLDRKLMSRGLISYRRLVGSCSKMALDGSIIVEICDETMAKMWRKPVEM